MSSVRTERKEDTQRHKEYRVYKFGEGVMLFFKSKTWLPESSPAQRVAGYQRISAHSNHTVLPVNIQTLGTDYNIGLLLPRLQVFSRL